MYMKKIGLVSYLTIVIIGFYWNGPAVALDFADWGANIWFKVTVSETGKAGDVVSLDTPQGGEVVTNNERTSNAYLVITRYDDINNAFNVAYCTFDGTLWSTKAGFTWPVIGGEPKRFLTLFNLKRQQTQNISEEYWIPLEVNGGEASNTVGEINSASFKNLGGIFLEQIGYPEVTKRGAGSVKFTGSLIKGNPADITDKLPDGCQIPPEPSL
jgi:hypothetical protein